jgi:MFS family permease
VLAVIVLWGVATGIQDSTVKAFVADLVPASRRATAYGVFAAVQGLGALAGGWIAGALVTGHVPVLAAVIGGSRRSRSRSLCASRGARPGP